MLAKGALDGLRVLLLEDELLIALDVEQVCQDEGCAEVTTFRELAEFEPALLDSDRFDIAIIDVMMGDGSTVSFAHTLRSREIPFIFATGLSPTEETFKEFPGIPVVCKPYATHELIAALQTVLAGGTACPPRPRL